METQLKQRLVGLTVIFSLAVIFLPMLLDGSGLAPEHVEISIPPKPQVNSNVRVEEKVIELKKETASLKRLQPVIVDEVSEPPDEVSASDAGTTESGKEELKGETSAAPPQKIAATDQKKEVVAEAEKKEAVTAPKETAQPPAVKQVKAEPEAKPAADSKPQVGGLLWVIQTGSFRDKNLAYKQRDRVRQSKLSAVFIEKYESNNKLSYRVRMGPFLERQKADVVKNKIRAKYNIKAIVMKYEK
jgi:DedD protein